MSITTVIVMHSCHSIQNIYDSVILFDNQKSNLEENSASSQVQCMQQFPTAYCMMTKEGFHLNTLVCPSRTALLDYVCRYL